MKTSLTTKTLAALLIMANISIACGNNISYINDAKSDMNELHSLVLSNVDGDSVKAESSLVTENKSNTPATIAPVAAEMDFSYLRFNVNEYLKGSESEITELPVSDFNYLRFDVNKYIEESKSEITELPVIDFDYLRFNVNAFMQQNPVDLEEMPVNELTHFDINQITESATANDAEIGELPLAE